MVLPCKDRDFRLYVEHMMLVMRRGKAAARRLCFKEPVYES